MAMPVSAKPHRATWGQASSSLNQPWAKASATSSVTSAGGVVGGDAWAAPRSRPSTAVVRSWCRSTAPARPGAWSRAAPSRSRCRRRSTGCGARRRRRRRGRRARSAAGPPCTAGGTSSASAGRPSGRWWRRRRSRSASTTRCRWHPVDEAALDGRQDDLVARRHLVESVERLAVRRAVAGDRRVAELAGHRGVGVVAGALLQVGRLHAGHDLGVEADRRDLDARPSRRRGRSSGTVGAGDAWSWSASSCAGRRRRRSSVVVGGDGGRRCRRRRRRGARSWSNSSSRRSCALGVLDARAPQLVGDEAEHQQPDGDEHLAERADDPPPVVRRRRSVPRRRWTGTASEATRPVRRRRGTPARYRATAPVASPGDGRHDRRRPRRRRGRARRVPGAGRRRR